MTNIRDIYFCTVCKHVVEVAFEGMGTLVCCGKPMVKLVANTVDAAKEKHVPVVEDVPEGIKVKVGSVEHPMEDKHYIKFIEVLTKDKVLRAELRPGMKPEAVFCASRPDVTEVREYCNLHGLWKA